MKNQLLGFIDALRQAGLTPSVSEGMDALTAVSRIGIERPVLREALAATLVKDHADRPTFDELFDRYFAAPPRAAARAKPKPAQAGEGAGRLGPGEGRGRQQEGRSGPAEREREEERQAPNARASTAQRLRRRRALLDTPFRDMNAREVEELDELLAELSRRLRLRLARRQRGAKRGRVDMRRTIRRAVSRGGVPIELLLRRPRPRKTDLVALVDLSYSTATAAEFLLALVAPARRYFRRVALLAYVDRPSPVSFEGGHVVPHGPLDLNARSDFGKVLVDIAARADLPLARNTLLLILGDARNNRLPPRADLLGRLHRAVRRVVWLNPEPRERWNSGDSVIDTYARHVDELLAAHTPRALHAALAELV
jgi:uncharacterized protein with von Willebrand factor type A (vWA) domain